MLSTAQNYVSRMFKLPKQCVIVPPFFHPTITDPLFSPTHFLSEIREEGGSMYIINMQLYMSIYT